MGPPQDFAFRRPMPVYNVPGEADLVRKICDNLACKPLEVNNLSSKFANMFNEVVRSHSKTPFLADKKNDGSFKKWLLACGFEVGPLFERNKSLVYLPVPAKPVAVRPRLNQERRYVYRGKHSFRGAEMAESWAIHAVEDHKNPVQRWKVKQNEKLHEELHEVGVTESVPVHSPEEMNPEVVSDDDEGDQMEKDFQLDEDFLVEDDDSTAWVEVHPAFPQDEEDDFILVGEMDYAWEEAVDFVTYNNHEILTDLSNRTGAMIDVSGQRDTPKRLSDRIITISGQAEQKAGACLGIVEKLRKLQDLLDSEIGFFVIIVPATAIPVIVGIKGATIAEVLAGTGVEISIGKENVMGMPDTPIGLEGTAVQVTTAVANIHKVVQDMADRGRLLPADFKYRPDKAAAQLAAGAGAHLPEVSLPPADHDLFYGMDPTQNFRTKARIVVDTGLAGWLIGKGGRTIREMQENSGAFLHVIREDEPTPLLRPGERLIEICGRLERKLEGIQVVLRTADSMPGNAPRDTRIIVPEVLANPLIMDQVASAYSSCVVERLPGSADGEAMLLVAGPVTSRIQAIQDFMSKTDRAHMEGIVVAKSVDGEIVGKDGRARREIREGLGYAPSNLPAPREPSPWLLRDPQEVGQRVPSEARSGAPPEHPQSESHVSVSEVQSYQAWQRADAWPASPDNSVSSIPSSMLNSRSKSIADADEIGSETYQVHEIDEILTRGIGRSLERPNGKSGDESSEYTRQAFQAPEPKAAHETHDQLDDPWPDERDFWQHQPKGHQAQNRQPEEIAVQPNRKAPSAETSKTSDHEQALQTLASVTEAAPHVEAMLLSSTSTGSTRTELSVILGSNVLFESLIPSGYLQDLSRRCQVHIDITADESLPSARQVVLSGSAAGNAAAAYWLQIGVMRHQVLG